MNPRTAATLEKLTEADWFCNVGSTRCIEDKSKVILLSSWSEAIAHCSATQWENLCLEAANQYRERLIERSKDRFNQWNELVGAIKPTTEALVREKIAEVARVNGLPKVFEDTVQWDILHVCMEAEFADVFPPGFYASQAYWYVRGHFPCGWEGDFPLGKLILF